MASNRLAFKIYPAPLDQVSEYTRKHSRTVAIEGHRLEQLLLQLLVKVVCALSWKRAYKIGRWIGLLLYRLRIRRSVAMVNLDIVYGDQKNQAEKDRIYRESLINCGLVLINYLRLPYQGEDFWREKWEFTNEHILKEAYCRNKGVLILGGHIGMMDMSGAKLGMAGYPVAAVGKPIRNKVLDKFLLDTRVAMNFGTIAHRNSMYRIFSGLRRGEAIALAMDQNMKTNVGVFIDWMGRPASSIRSAAFIAKKSGAAVVAGYCHQKGPDQFEVVATEEIPWEDYPEDPEKELLINTQKQSDAVQRIIYERPELWFWIHRRWKKQPQGMQNPYKSKKKKK
jgi:KDO2-lipid IV(A) lauroyltransferase